MIETVKIEDIVEFSNVTIHTLKNRLIRIKIVWRKPSHGFQKEFSCEFTHEIGNQFIKDFMQHKKDGLQTQNGTREAAGVSRSLAKDVTSESRLIFEKFFYFISLFFSMASIFVGFLVLYVAYYQKSEPVQSKWISSSLFLFIAGWAINAFPLLLVHKSISNLKSQLESWRRFKFATLFLFVATGIHAYKFPTLQVFLISLVGLSCVIAIYLRLGKKFQFTLL